MASIKITRRLVTLGQRRVHLRHAGRGPRLVLVHGSPASSEYFSTLIEQLAPDFCCIAPDTPGFGESDALPAGRRGIGESAAATAELIEHLNCGPCLILGTHTGASIALELALQRPDLVSGLILDGVALFDADEQHRLFQGYFEPLVLDERGGHFARTWTRIRDMFIWFPWTSHDPEHLNGTDLPPVAAAHRWTSMFFQAGSHYDETYRAAIRYAERAAVAAATQMRPAVYLAENHDMLAPHLDRLPQLKPDDRVERPSAKPGDWLAHIRRSLTRLAQSNTVTAGALLADPAEGTTHTDRFIELPHGQLRLRCYGDRSRPGILLLHDAPGTGIGLCELAQSLANDACVWLPDLPGYGSSEPLRQSQPELNHFAEALMPLLHPLQGDSLTVYGRGSGAVLALLMATRDPTPIRRLILDELPLFGGEIARLDARICPHLTLEPDGSHWYRTWQMLRDSQIYWPWYESRSRNLLWLSGNFSAEFLHEWTVQVLQQPQTAHCLPQACVSLDARRISRLLPMPTTFLARRGHPLAKLAGELAPLLIQGEFVAIDDSERATALRQRIGSAHHHLVATPGAALN